jgi:hypothetical protein
MVYILDDFHRHRLMRSIQDKRVPLAQYLMTVVFSQVRQC